MYTNKSYKMPNPSKLKSKENWLTYFGSQLRDKCWFTLSPKASPLAFDVNHTEGNTEALGDGGIAIGQVWQCQSFPSSALYWSSRISMWTWSPFCAAIRGFKLQLRYDVISRTNITGYSHRHSLNECIVMSYYLLPAVNQQ